MQACKSCKSRQEVSNEYFLANLASIQHRTSPLKFDHLAEKSEKGSTSNLSTKAPAASPDGPVLLGVVAPREEDVLPALQGPEGRLERRPESVDDALRRALLSEGVHRPPAEP